VFCGGTAVAVDTITFYLLAWLVLPCMRASDPVARLIEWVGFEIQMATEEEIKRNFFIIKGICFIVSNSVVYLLNVLFVFQSGKHKRIVEVLMFFGASLFQFFFIWLGRVLITDFGLEVTYSNITMLSIGILVNYFIRKFVIFKW
jgi:putative flippase GtrA